MHRISPVLYDTWRDLTSSAKLLALLLDSTFQRLFDILVVRFTSGALGSVLEDTSASLCLIVSLECNAVFKA